ncbi:MAG: GNAT family N-acetyltransferase [Acidimicrobiia bacterium]
MLCDARRTSWCSHRRRRGTRGERSAGRSGRRHRNQAGQVGCGPVSWRQKGELSGICLSGNRLLAGRDFLNCGCPCVSSTVSDAASVAALVRASEAVLIEDEGSAAPFWESMSERSHAENLASKCFRYRIAVSESSLLGFIAFRVLSHLFNIFLSPEHQRTGVGRALWQCALAHASSPIAEQDITVNAGLNAVPVYLAFGFIQVGDVIRQHGIAFVPMPWQAPNAA